MAPEMHQQIVTPYDQKNPHGNRLSYRRNYSVPALGPALDRDRFYTVLTQPQLKPLQIIMCKLFVLTGSVKRKTALAAIDAVNVAYRYSQRDGFGFVALQGPAQLPVAGWYKDPAAYCGFGVASVLPRWLFNPTETAERGEFGPAQSGLIVHGRSSTNSVSLWNVHPFVDEGNDVWLAHNGVLRWNGDKKDEPPSKDGCDSEQLLNWLTAGGQWDQADKLWTGYGAVAVGTVHDGQILIAHDGARLHMAKRANGPGWVLATDDDDLIKIAGNAGIGLATKPVKVPRCIFHFQADGSLGLHWEWKGFGNAVHTQAGFCRQYDATADWPNEGGNNGNGKFQKTYGKKGKTKHGQATSQQVTGAAVASDSPTAPADPSATAPVSIPIEHKSVEAIPNTPRRYLLTCQSCNQPEWINFDDSTLLCKACQTRAEVEALSRSSSAHAAI